MCAYNGSIVPPHFYHRVLGFRYRTPRFKLRPLVSPPPVEGAPRLRASAPSVDIDFPRERPARCSFSGVRISPGSRPSAGLSLPRSRPIRPGGMGPCESSLRLITNVDGIRECSLGGGGIRDELSPGEVPAGGPEPEEEVDERDTFDEVAPAVDLAVAGDVGGNGYSYGSEGSEL